MTRKIRIGNNSLPLPRSRIARVFIGVLLVAAGLLGFLPVIGFWMIPLGLLVLSVDLPVVRRGRRRLLKWWRGRTTEGQERTKERGQKNTPIQTTEKED